MELGTPVEHRLLSALTNSGFAVRESQENQRYQFPTSALELSKQSKPLTALSKDHKEPAKSDMFHRETDTEALKQPAQDITQSVTPFREYSSNGARWIYGLDQNWCRGASVYGAQIDIDILDKSLNMDPLMIQDKSPSSVFEAFTEACTLLQKRNALPAPEIMQRILDECIRIAFGEVTGVKEGPGARIIINLILRVLEVAAMHGYSMHPCQLGVLTLDVYGQHHFQVFPQGRQQINCPTVLLHRKLIQLSPDATLHEIWSGFVPRPASQPHGQEANMTTLTHQGNTEHRQATFQDFKQIALSEEPVSQVTIVTGRQELHPISGEDWRKGATLTHSSPKAPSTQDSLRSIEYAKTFQYKHFISEVDFAQFTVEELVGGAIHSDLLRGGNIRRIAKSFRNKDLGIKINWLRQHSDEPRQEELKSNFVTKRLSDAHKAEATRSGKSEAEVKEAFDADRLPAEKLQAAAARRQQRRKPKANSNAVTDGADPAKSRKCANSGKSTNDREVKRVARDFSEVSSTDHGVGGGHHGLAEFDAAAVQK